jgi:hypothetical protein
MGNTHTFQHRVPALSTACLAASALVLATLAGTSCSFLEINAMPDLFLLSSDEIQLTIDSAGIGVLCDNGFYAREGDNMWELSRIFLMVGLILGSMTTALAWAVSTFLPPTITNWKLISTLASVTAVVQVPIFLMFEAEPCSKFKINQECTLSIGSYFLIASTVFWVAVTLSTQCMDPPLWAIELAAWKNSKESNNQEADPELGEQQNLEQQSRFQRCFGRKQKQPSLLLPVGTESINEDENDREPLQQLGGNDESSIDSRLVLRVQSDGKIAGDDRQSFSSFGDLDSLVKDAEEGRLEERGSRRSPPPKSAIRSSSTQTSAPSYVKASSPSESKERVRIVTEYTNPSTASQPQEHIIIVSSADPDQPDTTPRFSPKRLMCGPPKKIAIEQEPSQSVPPDKSASPMVILKDLEEMPASRARVQKTSPNRAQKASPNPEQRPPNVEKKAVQKGEKKVVTPPAEPEKPQGDQLSTGLRALTKKMRRDARRKSRRGYNGYAIMDDEDDSFGDDESHHQSPPIEVKIQMDANEDDHRSLTDDEEELASEWEIGAQFAFDAGQFAAFAGAQFAAFADNHDDEEEEEDQPVDLYHSDPEHQNDPEPVYYSSDESKSELSLSSMEGTAPKSEYESDNSTLSSASSASSDKQSSQSRKSANSRRSRRGRRRRRPSPVNSIRSSRSLMELTIDEETDQDILEESADLERKMNPYSLSRTRSAPVQRGRTAARASQAGRARPSVDEGSPNFRVRRTSPDDNTPPASRSQLVEDIDSTHSEEKKEEDYFDGNSTDEKDYSLDVDEEENQDGLEIAWPSPTRTSHAKLSPSKTAPRSPSVSFRENVKLSPSKSAATSPSVSFREERSQKPVTRKDERTYIAGINARNPIVLDDSSERSVNSTISSRARKARIERLKPRPGDPKPRSDDSSVNSNSSMHARMARIQRVREALIKPNNQPQEEQQDSQERSPFRRGKEDVTTREIMPSVSQDSSTSEHLYDKDYLIESPRLLASDLDPDYDNYILDTLDLKLVEVRRPIDAEYGEEEASL